MSESEDTKKVEIDAEQVLDAEDYAHNRAVREIQDARADVREKIKDIDIDENAGTNIPLYQVTELANQTAVYAYEVLPLLRKSELPEDIAELPEPHPHDDVSEFATSMGMENKDKPCGIIASMTVYDRLNQICDELGIGVSLDKTNDGLEL